MDCTHVRMRGIAVAIGVTLAGCATPPAEEPASRTPDAIPSAPPQTADLRSIVDAAVRDAAQRLTVDAATIDVVSARAVTWSDGSLGCPEDGMMYSQALVPGYRVTLRAAGQVLDYHAAANGHVALCPPGRAVDPIQDARI